MALIFGITNCCPEYWSTGNHTFPVTASNVCHDKVIKRFLGIPGICESVQKLVTSFTIPFATKVPELDDNLNIFPVHNLLPSILCT